LGENCKNCGYLLDAEAHFCENCGARVIKNRITTKFLFSELLTSLGWDSLYFRTLKKMFFKPQDVLVEYIGGTRRKYINPFSHLLIGVALLLTVMNIFKKDFDNIMYTINKNQVEIAEKDLSKLEGTISEKEMKDLKRKQESARVGLQFGGSFLKYFNVVALLFIPIFAFISKLTYRKPYNYGEHIVINSYLYGTSMYFSTILLLMAVFIHPKIYFASSFVFMLYYLLVLSKMYKHSFGTAVVKLLRFLLFFTLVILAVVLIVSVITIVVLFSKVLLK